MPTPAAVEPPTPENIHLYRAAALAYRLLGGWSGPKDKLADLQIPLHAAALAAIGMRGKLARAAPGM
jgi:hypothetical protein